MTCSISNAKFEVLKSTFLPLYFPCFTDVLLGAKCNLESVTTSIRSGNKSVILVFKEKTFKMSLKSVRKKIRAEQNFQEPDGQSQSSQLIWWWSTFLASL